MNGIATFIEKIDDALNPIVVKELRQAVRGKFVVGVLILFLAVQLIVLGSHLVSTDINRYSQSHASGRNIFMFLFSILQITCMIFIPAYAAVRISNERSKSHVDLVFITILEPRVIISGKLFASLALAILIYSACMPFMTFTYLLRGIDLPSIFVLLGFGFMAVIASIQFAILLATLPSGKQFKSLLALGATISYIYGTGGVIGLSYEMLRSGIGSYIDSWRFWGPGLTIIFAFVAGIGLMYVLAVALIAPTSANRALPVRIFVAVIWILSLVVALIWQHITKAREALFIWMVASTLLFASGFLVAICERETPGPRVAAAIPQRRLWRLLAFFFYSGSGGGIVWCCLMAAMTFVTYALNAQGGVFGARLYDNFEVMIGIVLYAFAYCMTALLIKRLFLPDRVPRMHTWAIAMLLLLLGCILPLFCGFFFGQTRRFSDAWFVGNPFAMMGDSRNDSVRHMHMIFAGGWAFVIVWLNLRWLIHQYRNFRPYRAEGA